MTSLSGTRLGDWFVNQLNLIADWLFANNKNPSQNGQDWEMDPSLSLEGNVLRTMLH